MNWVTYLEIFTGKMLIIFMGNVRGEIYTKRRTAKHEGTGNLWF